MPITIWISLAALVMIAPVIAFVRSREAAVRNDATRRRAVMDDCGDDVVWEAGKLRPIVAKTEFEEKLSKRSFLKRVAFNVSAFSVAWLASREKNVAFGLTARSAKNRLFGKNGPVKEDDTPHQDNCPHEDDHTDSGGGDHGDSHSDTSGAHTDTGG